MRAAQSGQGDFRGAEDVPIRRGSAAPHATDALRDAPIARPKVAVDTVLFAIAGGRLKCYLVQLGAGGSAAGKWAFAGGLVRVGETLDEAARRELLASTGLGDRYLEQLFSFGDPSRDPTAHVVSVAYMALFANAAAVRTASNKYTGGRWFEV